MAETSTFPLRLPRSMKLAVQDMAQEDGVSLNQFVATAVAEKLAAMRTASYFAQHVQSADIVAFRRVLRRKGGQTPQPGDEILP